MDSASGTDTAVEPEPRPFVDYTADFGVPMTALPACAFIMGGGAGDPQFMYTDHNVVLTHAFWIGRTEVTESAWVAWPDSPSGSGPSRHHASEQRPVTDVSWWDVAQFANALSSMEGLEQCYLPDGSDLVARHLSDPYGCMGYRIPTEAEWECAARAGVDTIYAGSNEYDEVAWTGSGVAPWKHDVCTTPQPENAWDLCDLSGNVAEWTNDWYQADYYDVSPVDDPPGPPSGGLRVVRGGSFAWDYWYARIAERLNLGPSHRSHYVGFRLVRSADAR